jgi:penicillin-binding protein 1A
MSKKKKNNKPRQSPYRWMWFSLKATGYAFLTGTLGLFFLFLWLRQDLPSLSHIETLARRPSVTMMTEEGDILSTYGDLFEDAIRIDELPKHVIEAFMAIEDRRFYYHFGFDPVSLVRALYQNYRAGHTVQGASTLTQQLAKNLLFTSGLFSFQDRSVKRKLQELLLSLYLEYQLSKDDILSLYLNRVYFGSGTFGIDAAAKKYFGKSAQKLTVFEAAVIAGLLKAPSKYSPSSHPDKALQRAKIVLMTMKEAGFIEDIEPYLKESESLQYLKNNATTNGNKYFTDWIYENLSSYIDHLDRDVVVTVTLNPKIQQLAEKAIDDKIKEMGKELKVEEMALVAMKSDGSIQAMVGGHHYNRTQFNRATQAYRQPGSAFKPFVYLAALESGMLPTDMIDDTPVQIGNWTPGNFKWKSKGQVTLKDGLVHSINAVTVRLIDKVGSKKVIEVARRLGLNSDMISDLSLSLGTSEVTLLDLTSAYGVFLNGTEIWPYGVLEIRDKMGTILYSHEPINNPSVLIQEPYLFDIQDMMRTVVTHGTGRSANINVPMLAKTGSNGDKDAWFLGMTEPHENHDGLIVGIWAGNDKTLMSKKSVGSRLPAQTYALFMKSVIKDEKESSHTNLNHSSKPAATKSKPKTDNNELDSILNESMMEPIH